MLQKYLQPLHASVERTLKKGGKVSLTGFGPTGHQNVQHALVLTQQQKKESTSCDQGSTFQTRQTS